ncbi:MAG: amino acid adenylation domain-containing protein [Lachnospiraceae bacterium]|nr:amino acid adenylation domain-containing protein [Lachnospiraceae bacterium]
MVNTIAEYLRQTAKKYPDKVAFRDEKKSVTFGELDRCAMALAGAIHERLGGATKQAIGVYLPKGVDSIIAFMGVVYSGNYYTPLDTAMPEARLDKILSVLNPTLIVTEACYKETVLSFPTALIDEIASDNVNEAQIAEVLHAVIDTDILYVMFTSGSTGNPKGVIVTHRAVIDYVDWLEDTFSFDETTVFGNQAPFYFDNSVLDIYSTIRNGCETVIIPEEKFLSATRLLQYLQEKNVNTIFWVPSAMALVANAGALEKVSANQLTKILFAGEVMPTKQLNLWRKYIPNALYANLYGPTEIAVDCTYYIVDREFDDAESLPIGVACKNTAILVLNEKDELVSVGEIGELCVRGTSLAHGYYGNPEKTKEAFVQNPLNDKYPELIYRTGDLVKYNERGELLYVGRKDSQIKHSGYRIELGEIETAASAGAEVESCCAVYDDEKKQIVLFVTPETLDKKMLYAQLKGALPNYMMPKLIVAEQVLALNQNGKIDRLDLKRRLREGL